MHSTMLYIRIVSGITDHDNKCDLVVSDISAYLME